MYRITATAAPAAPPSGGSLHAAPRPPSGALDHFSAPVLDPSSSTTECYDIEAAHGAASGSAPGGHLPNAGPDVLDAGAFYRGVRRTGLQYGPAFRVVRRARADGSAALLR